jgi:hypothetical protein
MFVFRSLATRPARRASWPRRRGSPRDARCVSVESPELLQTSNRTMPLQAIDAIPSLGFALPCGRGDRAARRSGLVSSVIEPRSVHSLGFRNALRSHRGPAHRSGSDRDLGVLEPRDGRLSMAACCRRRLSLQRSPLDLAALSGSSPPGFIRLVAELPASPCSLGSLSRWLDEAQELAVFVGRGWRVNDELQDVAPV